MKTITAITFTVLAVLTTVSGAVAHAGVVRATIPFDFTVENRSLPAGTYEITQSPPLRGVIRIQNTLDPRIGTYVVTTSDGAESRNKSVLIFEQYGSRYFLHEVLGPGVMTVNLFVSKEEKQIRKQTAMLSADDTHPIVIAAK